ncbi:Vms1/Ankzf1 family peptidyl-tRNA hydrolase [Streptomyces sp. B6B3]|uniref:baeRF2 domain-containing protein n=1 Tax=Streptomyces sp. B6B3 TaxID=3153570 RepID=UPI00325D252B
MKLAHLSPLLHRPGPWASVYFDTTRTTEDGARQQELRARGTRDRLAEDGADPATREAVYRALVDLEPRTPGRALFATGGEVVLDTPLGGPTPESLSYWTPLPRVTPLLDLARPEPDCLVAFIDRRGADLEVRHADGTTEAAGTAVGEDWPLHRTSSAVDWSERHFQFAVENTWDENAERTADTIAECVDRTGAEVVVLVGDPRQRRAVHERLPMAVREVASEAEGGSRAPGSSSEGLQREIGEARAEAAGARADQALDAFLAGRGQAGQIADGVPALVDAARQHRIGTLLVRPDGPELERRVWVGEEPDDVTMRPEDTPDEGRLERDTARADDALLRAAAATGADVVALPPTGDAPAGGLGALLRWSE